MPYISVIVVAYDRECMIRKCLEAIKGSAYRDYELIIIDCNSRDATPSISREYTDKVITLNRNDGAGPARMIGANAAKGDIIVNIDSDVIIMPDTLGKIAKFLSEHGDVDAVTGLLSKDHPNRNFFSQYKNLYMHYIFKRLPENITFLYGSIYAIRRQVLPQRDSYAEIADDTMLGQEIISDGRKIAFLKDLEVIHLKNYGLLSFIRNDFLVPFNWAKIFLKNSGWRQLGKDRTGYAHSPKVQLVSIALSVIIVPVSIACAYRGCFAAPAVFLVLSWSVLNFNYLRYLSKEKGRIFAVISYFVTFIDNLIMAAGIFSGIISNVGMLWNRKKL